MDGVKPDIDLDEHYAEAMSPRPGNNEEDYKLSSPVRSLTGAT
ncbi:hypothetical protein PI125_g24527 [Phytophthora idaei]|nr:hypothetical protein PI125_g24527 [Phytophthora idaei]KAG3129169.1 hypothetical protein PI126_g21083 [Phytophthora idaei]